MVPKSYVLFFYDIPSLEKKETFFSEKPYVLAWKIKNCKTQ